VYDTFIDMTGSSTSLGFKHFFNSTDSTSADVSRSWRHGFSRNIVSLYSSSSYRPYIVNPDNSSLYNDEANACTNGFAEIKSRVNTWTTAIASYANGVCTLSVDTKEIGTLPLLYQSLPTPAPGTIRLIGYDVSRDDGQLIRFILDGNGSIINPPGINLKLQKTTSGFTVTDSNDNVEQYDANGKLLTVTSRTGVVQTMSFDGSGRLSNVSDSFGHQLIMNYDGQGHLSSVTRQ